MNNRRSLVTGGGGFIGAHLVRQLLEQGETVRVLELPDVPLPSLPSSVEVVRGSVCDASVVRDALDDVKRVLKEMLGPYCRSKFLAEQVAFQAARDGLPVVIVAPTLPIGPGDRLITPPTRMILDFLNVKIPAYYNCRFNLADVRDIARGHILAAEYGRPGERYILGHENITLGELLQMLQEITGLSMPKLRVPY